MSTTPMEMQDMQMSQPASMSHLSVFHFSQTEVILFPFWEISGALSLIISCLVVIGGCILLEYCRWIRQNKNSVGFAWSNEKVGREKRLVTNTLLMDTIVHILQLCLSYLAMCIFMTLNIWLCCSILIGEIGAHLAFKLFM